MENGKGFRLLVWIIVGLKEQVEKQLLQVVTVDLINVGMGKNVFLMSKKVYILIKRISSKYFFGFEYSNEKFCLPYSDIEKTFIDMVYYNENISNELVASIKKLHLRGILEEIVQNLCQLAA